MSHIDDTRDQEVHDRLIALEARRCLIAAAPELLAACVRALSHLERIRPPESGDSPLMDQLRAAIRRAKYGP